MDFHDEPNEQQCADQNHAVYCDLNIKMSP